MTNICWLAAIPNTISYLPIYDHIIPYLAAGMDFEDHLGTENLWLQTTWQQKTNSRCMYSNGCSRNPFSGSEVSNQCSVQKSVQKSNQQQSYYPSSEDQLHHWLGSCVIPLSRRRPRSGQLKLTIDKLKAATGTKEFTRLAAWSHYTKHHQPRQTIFTRQYKILSKGGSLKAYIGSVKKLVPSIPIQSQTSRRKRVLVHVHFQSRKKNTDWATVDFRVPFSLSQAHTSGRWRQNRQLGPWPHI